MNYKHHLIIAGILGIVLSNIWNNWLILPLTLVYTMLPDIDIRTSKTFKWYAVIAVLFGLYMILIPKDISWFGMQAKHYGIVAILSLGVLQFFQHREFFHSIAAGVMFALPFYLIDMHLFLSALLGFYLHLFLDDELFDGVWT